MNNKQINVFFDAGYSPFELLTSKETAGTPATPKMDTESYRVKCWGKTLTANTAATADRLEKAPLKLPIKKVTYIEKTSDSRMRQMLLLPALCLV